MSTHRMIVVVLVKLLRYIFSIGYWPTLSHSIKAHRMNYARSLDKIDSLGVSISCKFLEIGLSLIASLGVLKMLSLSLAIDISISTPKAKLKRSIFIITTRKKCSVFIPATPKICIRFLVRHTRCRMFLTRESKYEKLNGCCAIPFSVSGNRNP